MASNMAGFDMAAMRLAISKCDLNIKVFELAIQKELETKFEYQRIVRTLEEMEANKPAVTVEIVNDDEE